MADLRKNKERKQVVNKSLLENPDMETQANFSPYIIFLHAFILIILFSLLVMGYVLLFSPSKRATFSSKVYEGSFKEDVYYNADSCDLVVIKVYKDSRLAKKGDIVAYATNIEKGSGVLLSIDRDYVDIQKSSGEIIRVTVLSIIGKQIKTVPILGFFPAFLSSYFGVGILTAIIIVYIAIITFTRINYENTEEGKALFKQYKISQKEDKHRKSLLLKLKEIDGLDLKIYTALSGSMLENKENISLLDLETKVNKQDKFKYVLYNIHKTLVVQQELSKADKLVVTSLIELMCDFDIFDDDMEYMLIDLALLCSLEDFESQEFKQSVLEFIGTQNKEEYLINLGSVLYILVKKNKKILKPITKEILLAYINKCQDFEEDNKKMALGIAESINKMIN